MPEPATTWMARPGHPEAMPGTLSMDQGALRFDDAEGLEVRIPLVDVTAVRRPWGSSVITVRYTEDGGPREVSFYFAPPGPLTSRDRRGWQLTRGLERSAAILELRAANRQLKSLMVEWTMAIRRAAGG